MLRTIFSAAVVNLWSLESNIYSLSIDTLIDFLRLFIESIDFSESAGDGWVSLRYLCHFPMTDYKTSATIMLWVISQCS